MVLDKIFRLNTILMHATEPGVIFLDSLDCTQGLEYPKVFSITLVLKQLAKRRGYALFADFFFIYPRFSRGKVFFIKFRRSNMQIHLSLKKEKKISILFKILK
jgi:hypothetical protein